MNKVFQHVWAAAIFSLPLKISWWGGGEQKEELGGASYVKDFARQFLALIKVTVRA